MTKTDPAQPLKDYQPRHRFFVGIDSDGCAFETMAAKQQSCFCPEMTVSFGLQPVAQAVRECMDFAALYSRTRGANRHQTARRVIAELLPAHPMVKRSGFKVPHFPHYFQWVDDPNSVLSNAGLLEALDRATDPAARKEFETALQWSRRADRAIDDMIRDIPPFPGVHTSLEKIAAQADVAVISSASQEALEWEWTEHQIAQHVTVIAGQEMGSKTDQLRHATEGKYEKTHVLMIGDTPGDMQAARANEVLFYPIHPGHEIESWKRFHDEAFDRFIKGRYAGAYEARWIAEFDRFFFDSPPWQR
ncbi:MAG TPA: HAD hydrolase-like protein [Sedimentisphaerales bacterium]|nr:HAD hydrolase-like protein [Sedimentisphaerales bacterium]HRS10000.1 HAD hydrolase-like protein [Sedimentisphaerales bacterium]HRV46706.1 HAD hydrolase-like protein [Sedimentisphaerales bacterium]